MNAQPTQDRSIDHNRPGHALPDQGTVGNVSVAEPGGPFLHVVGGSATGMAVAVGAEFRMGRDQDGPGRLGGDLALSRHHAMLTRTDDGSLTIVDLASTNGTYLNGRRVTKPEAVRIGDTIHVGETVLRITLGPPDSPAAVSTISMTQVTAAQTPHEVTAPVSAATPPSGRGPGSEGNRHDRAGAPHVGPVRSHGDAWAEHSNPASGHSLEEPVPEDPAKLLAEAQSAYAAKRWKDSAPAYQRLLPFPDLAAEGCYGLGMIALAHGSLSEAYAMFVAAVGHDHGHANAWYQLGQLAERQSPQQAAVRYAAALQSNPSHFGALAALEALKARSGPSTRDMVAAAEPSADVPASADKPRAPVPAGHQDPADHIAPDKRDQAAAIDQAPAAPDSVTGRSIENILRDENTSHSRDALSLIESLKRCDVSHLRFSAYFDSILTVGLWLFGAAVIAGFGSAILLTHFAEGQTIPFAAVVGFDALFCALILGIGVALRAKQQEPTKSAGRLSAMLTIITGSAVGFVLWRHGVTTHTRGALIATPLILAAAGSGAATLWYFLTARGWSVRIANGRVFYDRGVVEKDAEPIELWTVRITTHASYVNRMTRDKTLIFIQQDVAKDGHPNEIHIKGLGRADEVEKLYHQLNDLRTLLRADPYIKGIISA